MPESAPDATRLFYLLPGLGADERVFKNLLPLLQGEAHVLPWLLPQPAETLAHYASRIAEKIPVERPCFVVGVSFGGIVALEIGRLRPLARVVQVSSIPSAQALPWWFRLARATGIYKLLPPQVLPLFPRAGQWYFGVNNGPDYQLFRQILRDTDPTYACWAIDRLLHWQSAGLRPALRIHGTHDRVLPRGSAPVDYLIPGGTHFMILSRAEEISRILNDLPAGPLLNSYQTLNTSR